MVLGIIVWLLLAGGLIDDDLGRKGNDLFREGKYREAADTYLSALEQLSEDAPEAVRAALLNNLGAALYRLESYDGAQTYFIESLAVTEADGEKSRAAYNAGNAAFRQNSLKAAATFYKQALLANPDNESARFNYEFLARRLEEQPETAPQQSENRIDPSEYAKALKKQAEQLVADRKYRAAYDLMIEGLKVDETVQAYQTFIGRTGKVAEIDQLAPS